MYGELNYLNVGTGVDLRIMDFADTIAANVGYKGVIHWSTSKLDGTPKKQLNVNRMISFGWQFRSTLEGGLTRTIKDLRDQSFTKRAP